MHFSPQHRTKWTLFLYFRVLNTVGVVIQPGTVLRRPWRRWMEQSTVSESHLSSKRLLGFQKINVFILNFILFVCFCFVFFQLLHSPRDLLPRWPSLTCSREAKGSSAWTTCTEVRLPSWDPTSRINRSNSCCLCFFIKAQTATSKESQLKLVWT